jgi:hypothetical protein
MPDPHVNILGSFESSVIRDFREQARRKEKGSSAPKHQMSNSPIAHALNEYHVLPMDWTMDGPSPWM